MSDLIEGGNWGMTRRHLTTAMTEAGGGRGRTGKALCHSENNPVDIYDQAYHDVQAETWGYDAKVIADLPPCKRCAKKAEKLKAGAR